MKRPVSTKSNGPVAGADATLQRRICDAIKGEIARGVYGAGDRLPSTRAFAAEWGVSRTTVTAAYEQLLAEGYLETRRGARARIAPGLGRIDTAARCDQAADAIPLSRYGRRLSDVELPPPAGDPAIADFRYGVLAAADFPTLMWRRAVNGALMRRPVRLQYGDPQGSPDLRAALQGYLWRARGLRCEADDIVVVNGSQQGVDLCARLLVDPGDRVVIEDPSYVLARQVFAAAGAELVASPVDRDGMRVDGLGSARLAFVTPSHQFPLGSIMSAARRQELLAWARRAGAYVVEDDYDAEYRYGLGPIPTLRSLDGGRSVVYVGTVSKTLSPTLRLGYLVVPAALGTAFIKAKRMCDRHTPDLEQAALASLIANGAYERHVRRARRRNGERRAALLAALEAELGDAVTVAGADAGLHVVVWLSRMPRASEDALVAAARSAGIGLYGVSRLYATPPDPSRPAGLVMGYSALDERQIVAGVRRLKAVLATMAA